MNAEAQNSRIAKLFFSLLFTGLLLVLIEIASFVVLRMRPTRRLQGMGPPGPQSSVYKSQPWAELYWKEEEMFHTTFAPYVMWANPRSYHSQTIVTDENGQRQTFHSSCTNHSFTIWMFGGSTLRGFGTPDWETIPSHLAADFRNSGQTVCVRNFGTDGFASTQEVIQLMLELTRRDEKPNLVIFYDGINEVFSLYESGKPDYPMGLGSVARDLRRATAIRKGSFSYLLQTNTAYLISWMGEALKQRLQSAKKQLSEAEVRREAEVVYRENTLLVADLASKYGFQYAFFWQPCDFIGRKQRSREEEETIQYARLHRPGLEEAHQEMDRFIHLQTISHFFDIADVFDNLTQTIYIDYYHVSPEGNRLIAERMFEVIRAAHFG